MKTRSLERSLTMTDRRIGVLVVDDSKVGQMLLVHILESDAEMCVVGAVSNGQAALDFVTDHRVHRHRGPRGRRDDVSRDGGWRSRLRGETGGS
jgi:hypothetical protein